ncbi:MAG: ABC transporter substrate-binding protein [Clostridiaceae bacterium]|nr:ABC transporter substrate-binding protein [Clostridiaceae bacterium]
MKLKSIIVFLVCAAMVLSMVACSPKTSGEPAKPAETAPKADETGGATKGTPSGGKVTVDFWHSMSGATGELLDSIIAQFNSEHDNIEVVGTFQGGYWEAASKAQTAIAAGENPDVLMMGADHVSIFAQEEGLLEDLIPYMKKSGISPDDFVESLSWDYKINGKMIAIPFGRSTPALYVNKDMLKEAGVEVPKTWDEMEQVCKVIVEGGYAEYGFAMPYDTWFVFMITAQYGGKFFNEDQTALGCIEDGSLERGLTMFQNMAKKKYMFYGPTDNSFNVCTGLFLDRGCAMVLASTGNLSGIARDASFDFELAFVPAGTVQTVPTGGNSLVMMAASDSKEEAWEFLRWLIQEEAGNATFVKGTGYLPTTYSMTEMPIIQEYWKQNPHAKTAFEQLKYATDPHRRKLFVTVFACQHIKLSSKAQLTKGCLPT